MGEMVRCDVKYCADITMVEDELPDGWVVVVGLSGELWLCPRHAALQFAGTPDELLAMHARKVFLARGATEEGGKG